MNTIVCLNTSILASCLQPAVLLSQKTILINESGRDFALCLVGAFGGRIDHTLSNINTLYTHQHLRLVLCGEGSLARLIPKGHTTIQPDLSLEGPECGVLALGAPATASSTGLKWNLGIVPIPSSGSGHRDTSDICVLKSNYEPDILGWQET